MSFISVISHLMSLLSLPTRRRLGRRRRETAIVLLATGFHLMMMMITVIIIFEGRRQQQRSKAPFLSPAPSLLPFLEIRDFQRDHSSKIYRNPNWIMVKNSFGREWLLNEQVWLVCFVKSKGLSPADCHFPRTCLKPHLIHSLGSVSRAIRNHWSNPNVPSRKVTATIFAIFGLTGLGFLILVDTTLNVIAPSISPK